jgi:hypothetical protein
MHAEDLTEYRFANRFPLAGVLNVGWLGGKTDFPVGALPIELLTKLVELTVTKPVNQTRGFHRCELCGTPQVDAEARGQSRALGSAEVWLPGDGCIFASPDMLVHYIREHSYLPPERYLEALGRVDPEHWNPPKDFGLELYRQSLARGTVGSAREP